MPIYEYWCSNCNQDLELIQPYRDRDEVPPCRCGGYYIRKPSKVYYRPESMWIDDDTFGRVTKNDTGKSPFGDDVEPRPGEDYKSDKVQVDYGD